jgi:hypothetical protein
VKGKTDKDGNYKLVGVPAGHASVTAFASGYLRKTVTADLLAGKEVRVDIRLRRPQKGEAIGETP